MPLSASTCVAASWLVACDTMFGLMTTLFLPFSFGSDLFVDQLAERAVMFFAAVVALDRGRPALAWACRRVRDAKQQSGGCAEKITAGN